jgi:hypothetical protein
MASVMTYSIEEGLPMGSISLGTACVMGRKRMSRSAAGITALVILIGM